MALSPQRCLRCQKRLSGQTIQANQGQYHSACFYCDLCKKPLEKTFYPKGERLYHAPCYEKLFVPKCGICGQSISGEYIKTPEGRVHAACYDQTHNMYCCICNTSLRGRYTYDLWGNKAHLDHEGQATRQCHVCARIISNNTSQGGYPLPDGRITCGYCHASELKDFQAIQRAKLEVIAQMQAVGFDYIPDYIRANISEDQQLLNQRLGTSPTGNIHGYTRSAQRHIPNYGLILEHSIYIISGLPKVAFMGVLSHELLHVWINEKNLRHLTPPQVEGFCNLGTALMYQNEASELARVLLERMEKDPDPVYGDGYRLMAKELKQRGWPALIHALQTPGALPTEGIKPPPETIRSSKAPADSTQKPAQPMPPTPPIARPAGPPRKPDPQASQKLDEIKARLQSQIRQKSGNQPPEASKKGLKKLGRKKPKP